ncbi:cytochrome P450 302a1, mitochondrial isoform X2 [Toxorhynchites rutilus septentrionalis]|nr:cytochrome P450 302a1, mitochondrial isoform X2 [Toxorhynchites rutilus septentrionalis]
MLPGNEVVWIYNPDDIATVLNDQTPGMYPSRRSHTALAKYRRDRPNIYRTAGLLASNGPEWWKIRCELQKGLSSPKSVRYMLPLTDQATKEFVAQIRPTTNSTNVPDFMDALSRLNLELTCLMAFDVRMDSFSEEQMQPNSVSTRLIDTAEITNQNIIPTDHSIPLWKLFETPAYRKLRESQEYMEKIAIEMVANKKTLFDANRSKQTAEETNSRSLLEDYLRNPNLEISDIVGMAADILLAGVHTSTYTTSFALYHLCKHPEVQQKLYEEASKILPDPRINAIEPVALNSEASYCRSVLKESLRLNPISVGVGRILNKDTVLAGYNVPKGTVVVTQNMISCRLDKYFKDPHLFNPNRWMRANKENINPYLVLPFGHGMRSCIARRMAEQSMLVLLLRLIRSFEISWAGTEHMDIVSKLINQPDQPIKILFKPREK